MIHRIQSKEVRYYNRDTKRELKKQLLMLGVTSSKHTEFLMQDILGDNSAPNEDQQNSLERLTHFMNSGDDIIIDLRANNGKCPKFDDFWEVLANFIEEKTAVKDRRHNNSDGEGELVLNLAMENSYADMYWQCVEISKTKDIIIPSYAWFLLQFWPTIKTALNILHYTGRFKVKKMVQARIPCKNNPDTHYTNAVYSFLRKRAVKFAQCTTFTCVDAKCKVSIGEHGFPIAAVSRGKQVIVGCNQSFQVGDHDFSKLSFISDAILVHDIPQSENDEELEDENEVTSERSKNLGEWFQGSSVLW